MPIQKKKGRKRDPFKKAKDKNGLEKSLEKSKVEEIHEEIQEIFEKAPSRNSQQKLNKGNSNIFL